MAIRFYIHLYPNTDIHKALVVGLTGNYHTNQYGFKLVMNHSVIQIHSFQ